MAEKFDKFYGKFKVSIGGKDYPFAMTLRHRGMFSNIRSKMDQEAIIMFLFERFREGYIADCASQGKTPTQEEVSAREAELADWLMKGYEEILTEVLIELGITTREKIREMEARYSDPDFLSEVAVKKMNEVGEPK